MKMNLVIKNLSIEINSPPKGLENQFAELFTPDAISFLTELVSTFQYRAQRILLARRLTKLTLNQFMQLPEFGRKNNLPIFKEDWKISSLPFRLQNRHLDLGDVAPSDSQHLKISLQSPVQGIQIDFDDGQCPSWKNMIEGIHNIMDFTRGKFFPKEVPSIEQAPILMMRPRAWNMNEHNIMVNGKEIPGPLMDFGLLMFHTGKNLARLGVGPFFYLSKIEGSLEARLWNDIFVWTQLKLGIPQGTIKACVLIENILASFEMDEILFELREHSLGLNCGIWDYAASFVNKFGDRHQFLLPDRNKYVNMEKHFLISYMKLVVQTCHRRGAPATGGMAALTLATAGNNKKARMNIIENVCKSKLREIHSGVDGFMVYDPELVPWLNETWKKYGSDFGPNQISSVLHSGLVISALDLLQIPSGGITTVGLKQNIKVGILFIYSWIANGKGHFILDGAVEDSATAEISRSQIWQWIYHQTRLEDGNCEKITKSLVVQHSHDFISKHITNPVYIGKEDLLEQSLQIFLEIVTAYEFPEFITTYLYNHSTFRYTQQS